MTSEPVRPQLPSTSGDPAGKPARTWPLPPWAPAALLGTALVPVVIFIGHRALSGRSRPPAWPGLVHYRTVSPPSVVMAAALAAAALIAAWIWLRRRAGRALRLRAAAGLAAVWALLLTLGPPLLSNDVYSYAAVGRLTSADLDPYSVGPAALGPGPFLAAVDPLWRHTPTPYGPLLVTLFHADAFLAHGSVLATILLLRAGAVLVTAGAVALAVWAARPQDRVAVLLLTGLNPVLLLHLIAGTHMDALIGVAAVGVVVLAAAGRWAPAMALAVLATMVKAPALALVGFVLVYAVRRAPPERRLAVGAGSVGVAAATTGVLWLVLPNAFGWVHALLVPAEIGNPRVPSVWLGYAIRGVVALLDMHIRAHTASSISRLITLVIGAVVAVFLLVRASDRPGREHALRCVGWALLVVAISSPVVYGWYLAWGLFAAAAGSRPRERPYLVAVSAVTFALTVPAMKTVPSLVQVALWAVAALLWWLAAGRPRPARRRTTELVGAP